MRNNQRVGNNIGSERFRAKTKTMIIQLPVRKFPEKGN